jgi:hypothetical protein
MKLIFLIRVATLLHSPTVKAELPVRVVLDHERFSRKVKVFRWPCAQHERAHVSVEEIRHFQCDQLTNIHYGIVRAKLKFK